MGREITELTLHPSQFGLPVHPPLTEVGSSTPAQNLETFKLLLTSRGEIPAHIVPVLDFVLLNTSALLVLAGLAAGFEDGVQVSVGVFAVKLRVGKALQLAQF